MAGAAAHAAEAATAKGAAAEAAAAKGTTTEAAAAGWSAAGRGTARRRRVPRAASARTARAGAAKAAAIGAARRGRGRVASARRTGSSVPGAAKAPEQAAQRTGEGVKDHRHDDEQQDDREQDGDKAQQNVAKTAAAAVVIISRLVVGAVVRVPARKAHAVDVRNGLGHVPGAGGHGVVIVLPDEVVLHGLGKGTGLTFQRGVAETVAVGQVVVAVLVLLRLHHQQDQHTVVFRRRADAPGVEGLQGVVLGGQVSGVIHRQHADRRTFTAGLQLSIQVGDGLHSAAAQDVGLIHHTLAAGQRGQAGRGRKGRAEGGQTHHPHQHQSTDLFYNVFHAKGSTSFTPARPPSTLAGNPPTSF